MGVTFTDLWCMAAAGKEGTDVQMPGSKDGLRLARALQEKDLANRCPPMPCH
jgi:hypothetical protein